MKAVLLLFLAVVSTTAMANDVTQGKIETPHGEVVWKEQSMDPQGFSEIVRELSRREESELRVYAGKANGFIEEYVAPSQRQEDMLLNLDAAFARWTASKKRGKESQDDVIHIVGAAFGFYCIEKLGMRWAIVRDEHGTTTALVRQDPAVRSFPFSSVQYRIEDGRTEVAYALYIALKQTIVGAEK